MKHFLDLKSIDQDQLRAIVAAGLAYKKHQDRPSLMQGLRVLQLFKMPSTRTRLSFCHAIDNLGGKFTMVNDEVLNIARGETLIDSMEMFNIFHDMLVVRWPKHQDLIDISEVAKIPIINALTEKHHPCQAIADVMTMIEEFGDLKERKVAWLGEVTNVLTSLCHLAPAFGFSVAVAAPASKANEAAHLGEQHVSHTVDPKAALNGADVVMTDTWSSMSDQEQTSKDETFKRLSPYQVNARAMASAAPTAIFMHCLPAYRGREVTADVLQAPYSRTLRTAENRSHGQAAVMAWCLGKLDQLT